MKIFVVDMVSQTWRSPEDVDRTQWQHWVTLAVPDALRSNIGLLFIGGGRNSRDPPSGPSDLLQLVARATGTVVAELHMVPNQPLTFHRDGHPRVEDDLIGYTWDRFLQTGDATWAAHNPMVKSAVRAMDTMTAVAATEAGGEQIVDRFVVASGSKRRWTTWLTGAVDDRVAGIVPIVIDVLNIEPSMRHHFAAYGFWAPAIGDYVQHRIMERLDNPRLRELYQWVDPHAYRHRLTMPKFVLNAVPVELRRVGQEELVPGTSPRSGSPLENGLRGTQTAGAPSPLWCGRARQRNRSEVSACQVTLIPILQTTASSTCS